MTQTEQSIQPITSSCTHFLQTERFVQFICVCELGIAVVVVTFGLHSEGHVVGRVVSLPEVSETLVGVDVFLSGFVLQSLGVACGG